MEGAIGERLKKEYGIVFDDNVAMASLVYSKKGRDTLEALWLEYAEMAFNKKLPFIATTPTRRANKERIHKSGFGDNIIRDNTKFLRNVQKKFKGRSYIGALMGCVGDAYSGKKELDAKSAKEFHSYAAELFKEAGADFLYAGIMPEINEALGMAMAMGDTGLPYIISFMIRDNGCLMDGTTISEAISIIDGSVDKKPLCYMTNCVYPLTLYKAVNMSFNKTEIVKKRFLGIQANASPLPPDAIDGKNNVKCEEPKKFAQDMMKLKDVLNVKIWGGCCGTNDEYIKEVLRLL